MRYLATIYSATMMQFELISRDTQGLDAQTVVTVQDIYDTAIRRIWIGIIVLITGGLLLGMI